MGLLILALGIMEKIDKAKKLIEEELDRGGLKKEGETACPKTS